MGTQTSKAKEGPHLLLSHHDLMDLRTEWEVPWEMQCLSHLCWLDAVVRDLGLLLPYPLSTSQLEYHHGIGQGWMPPDYNLVSDTPTKLGATFPLPWVGVQRDQLKLVSFCQSFWREQLLLLALPAAFFWVMLGQISWDDTLFTCNNFWQMKTVTQKSPGI